VDHINEVQDVALQDQLNETLVQSLRGRNFERLWLTIPEPIDWQSVGGFKFRTSHRVHPHDDLHIRDFLNEFGERLDALDVDFLKRHRKVYVISRETEEPFKHWPVYRCICFETQRDNDTFLLNGGRWFRVAPDYLQAVRQAIDALPEANAALPPFVDQSEQEYNSRVAEEAPAVFCLMDRKLILFRGAANKIEFCDLFAGNEKQIIHVKRYGGSSVLSHLFSQGVVSATLFAAEADFRCRVNEELSAVHRIAEPLEKPGPNEYEVVFAVVSKSTRRIASCKFLMLWELMAANPHTIFPPIRRVRRG